jgi:riboflavin kinase / FMN adenylyltransferase
VKVIRLANELQSGTQPVCAAIGVFDGLHLGHQAVLGQTLRDAKACDGLSVAVTFDRHPNAVVAPNRTPALIQSLDQRLSGLEDAGFDATWLIPFDISFSRIPAETFVRQLVHGFGQVHSLSVGATFTFGHQRAGNLDLLKRLGDQLDFIVHGVPAVAQGHQPISSTRVRDAIQRGDLAAVHGFLGRPYTIAGRVIRGDQRGRQLGFPTANLDVAGLALPPAGVYAATARLNRVDHPAVLNLGHRPTIQTASPRLQFEVHLLDFSGDLYHRTLEITLHQHLRDEQRFPSLEALQQQIREDLNNARRILRSAHRHGPQ